MRDWQTELDELLARSMAFAASVKSEVSHAPQGLTIADIRRTPAGISDCSEREEITKRVAIFKAHQQRLIRDRKDYADSVLSSLRAQSPSRLNVERK